MKYDDEEKALAAILLAHTPQPTPMPEALERKIAAQARAFSEGVRFSTTKGAAIAAPAIAVPPKTSRRREWAAWAVAAACFAFGAYEWRSRTLAQEAALRAAASSASDGARELVGRDTRGAPRFAFHWSDARHEGVIEVVDLPASAPGERYTLWLSRGGADASPVGSFVCDVDCRGRAFGVRADGDLKDAKRVWLTHGASGMHAATFDPADIVAEGRE